jgi:predicted RNase H-like HicB family nuclease
MPKIDNFDGHTVNLYLDEDGDWLAHVVDLPNVSAFGDTPEQAIRELGIAWEGIKESYRKRGEPVPVASSGGEYSGYLNVRIDRPLHRALAMEAARTGVSLNAVVARKLAEATHTDSRQHSQSK